MGHWSPAWPLHYLTLRGTTSHSLGTKPHPRPKCVWASMLYWRSWNRDNRGVQGTESHLALTNSPLTLSHCCPWATGQSSGNTCFPNPELADPFPVSLTSSLYADLHSSSPPVLIAFNPIMLLSNGWREMSLVLCKQRILQLPWMTCIVLDPGRLWIITMKYFFVYSKHTWSQILTIHL